MPRFGEGQWALGYREPLNKSERLKRDDDGLNVRARIENVYSKQGFRSIVRKNIARKDARMVYSSDPKKKVELKEVPRHKRSQPSLNDDNVLQLAK